MLRVLLSNLKRIRSTGFLRSNLPSTGQFERAVGEWHRPEQQPETQNKHRSNKIVGLGLPDVSLQFIFKRVESEQDGIVNSTTAKENKEELEQKLETINDQPLVEAATPTVSELRPPTMLGNNESKVECSTTHVTAIKDSSDKINAFTGSDLKFLPLFNEIKAEVKDVAMYNRGKLTKFKKSTSRGTNNKFLDENDINMIKCELEDLNAAYVTKENRMLDKLRFGERIFEVIAFKTLKELTPDVDNKILEEIRDYIKRRNLKERLRLKGRLDLNEIDRHISLIDYKVEMLTKAHAKGIQMQKEEVVETALVVATVAAQTNHEYRMRLIKRREMDLKKMINLLKVAKVGDSSRTNAICKLVSQAEPCADIIQKESVSCDSIAPTKPFQLDNNNEIPLTGYNWGDLGPNIGPLRRENIEKPKEGETNIKLIDIEHLDTECDHEIMKTEVIVPQSPLKSSRMLVTDNVDVIESLSYPNMPLIFENNESVFRVELDEKCSNSVETKIKEPTVIKEEDDPTKWDEYEFFVRLPAVPVIVYDISFDVEHLRQLDEFVNHITMPLIHGSIVDTVQPISYYNSDDALIPVLLKLILNRQPYVDFNKLLSRIASVSYIRGCKKQSKTCKEKIECKPPKKGKTYDPVPPVIPGPCHKKCPGKCPKPCFSDLTGEFGKYFCLRSINENELDNGL